MMNVSVQRFGVQGYSHSIPLILSILARYFFRLIRNWFSFEINLGTLNPER